MKKAEKWFKISCVFIILFIILSAFHAYPISYRTDLSQNYTSFERDWLNDDEKITFPYRIDRNIEKIVITNTLPEVDDTDKLILRDSFKGIRVFVNEELIYEYMPETTRFSRLRGDLYLYVPLKMEYSHQPVSIEVIGDVKIPGTITSIDIGDEASFMYSLSTNNPFNRIILIMMFMFGFGLLGVAVYLDLRKKNYDYRIFLYLGIFSLITAVWIWTDSPIYHVNTADAASVALLSFICFMAIPLPIVAFVDVICIQRKKSLQIISNILFLNMLIQSLFFVLGLTEFIQLLPLTHFLLVVSVILMSIALIDEVKANNSMMAKGFLISLSILGLFSLITLIQFYISPIVNGRNWFMVGFISFIMLLVYFSIKRIWLLYEQNTKLKLYQNMAYNDMMTMAQNRTAFNEKMIQLEGIDLTSAVLLIMDINNLKQINDQYGHQAGDRMIIDTCSCILSIFEDIANVYRIGGDEFAVLITEHKVNMKEILKKLDETISSYNLSHQNQISLAYGYAIGDENIDIEALFKQADKNMYLRKFEQKKELL